MSTLGPRGGAVPAARPRLRTALAVAPPGALLVLAGCGAQGGEPLAVRSTVTVTASPSAPSPASSPSSPEGPSSSAAPSAAPSVVPAGDPAALPRQERGHDVGLVTGRTDTPDGVVLAFDRLTVVGLSDEELAASGTPVQLDDGDAFTNQAQNVYEVGVSPQARFFLTTCTSTASGPTIASESVDLDTFLAAGLDGTAVSFDYVEGLLVRAETNPRC